MNFETFLRWERSTRDTIDFKKMYVDVAGGDVLAGLVLSEIVYWYLGDKLRVRHDGEYWIACKRYEWWERTRLSPNQIDYVIKKLLKLELIFTHLYRFDGLVTTHIRLNTAYFLERVEAFIEVPASNPHAPLSEYSETELVNFPNSVSGNFRTPLTETSSETTTDNAGRPEGHPAPLASPEKRVKPNRSALATDRDMSEKTRVSPTDPNFPSVGRLLMQALRRGNNTTTNLTSKQISDLTEAVIIKNQPDPVPSPQEEFEAYPRQFTEFMSKIERMAYVEKNGVTAGNLIKAMRGYHFYGGWFKYRPDSAHFEEAPEYQEDAADEFFRNLINKRS